MTALPVVTLDLGGAQSSHSPSPAIRSVADLAAELRRQLREAEVSSGKTIGKSGLARRIGVSASSLYAYLNGTTLIPADALAGLLRELDSDEPHAR